MACKGGRLISRKGGDANERLWITYTDGCFRNVGRAYHEQKEIDRPCQGLRSISDVIEST